MGMPSASKIPIQEILGNLMHRQHKILRDTLYNSLIPRGMNRQVATYHRWCGKPFNQMAHAPFCIPSLVALVRPLLLAAC
eukprot:405557-Pelagomonas_calceolata.AAC.1